MNRTTARIAAVLAPLALSALSAAQQPAAPAAPAPAPAQAAPAKPEGPQFKAIAFEGAKPAAVDVFRKHLEAVGGEKAWETKKQARMKGGLEIPAAGLKGSMEMLTIAPGKVLVTMDMPGMGTTRSGCDGATGWSIDPMRGPALMSDSEIADLLRDSNFQRDLALVKDPAGAEVLGLFEFEGTPCWRVKVMGSGTKPREMHQFYEKDSGLMRGTSLRVPTPMGEIPAIIEVTQYRDFGDVRMPTVTTTKVMGQRQVMTVDSVEWSGVDEKAFELPEEIKALKAGPAKPAGAAPAGSAPAAPPVPPSAK